VNRHLCLKFKKLFVSFKCGLWTLNPYKCLVEKNNITHRIFMYVKNYCVMSNADNRLIFAQKCPRSKQNVGKKATQHSALSLLPNRLQTACQWHCCTFPIFSVTKYICCLVTWQRPYRNMIKFYSYGSKRKLHTVSRKQWHFRVI